EDDLPRALALGLLAQRLPDWPPGGRFPQAHTVLYLERRYCLAVRAKGSGRRAGPAPERPTQRLGGRYVPELRFAPVASAPREGRREDGSAVRAEARRDHGMFVPQRLADGLAGGRLPEHDDSVVQSRDAPHARRQKQLAVAAERHGGRDPVVRQRVAQ